MGAALTSLANDRGGRPISIDAYKVSHHGSCRNVTAKLLALTPAAHYLLSTNGDRFDHPDDIAVARIITSAPADATLWFNYTNDRNARWNDPQLQHRYRYTTQSPGDDQEGVTVTLPARDRTDQP